MDPTACARRILDLPRGAERDQAVASLAIWLHRGGFPPRLSADEWRRLARFRALAAEFSCYRVRLDRGGYERSGRYWGTGAPLYRVDLGHCTIEVRA